jgi:D-galactarolactone cycloisomerase
MPDQHRIACIRTYHLRCKLPEVLASPQERFDHRTALLVQIVADSGAEGWGECAGPPEIGQPTIQAFYGPRLLGKDALQTDILWSEMWRASLRWARRGVMLGALSGIDMALWDLKGQVLNRPLSEMMGGRLRDRVSCYATGLYVRDRPETELIPLLVEEAHDYVEAGYRAVKTQIGRNLAFDTSLVRALRAALPTTPLFADANRAYDLTEATSIGRALEEANFAWFEEPLSPEYPGQYRQLSDRLRVPIAAGETEQTRWGFQAMLSPGGVGIAQPDLSFCGGPSEAQRIRAISAAQGVNLTPHSDGTMLNLAAALHFLASDFRQPGRIEPSMMFLGRDGAPNPLRDAIFSTTLEIDGGTAYVPTTPGLGVTVDVDEMRGFCVSEQELTA